MREAFDRVKGAISRQDIVPALSQFAVKEGRVYAFDGRVQISTPVKALATAGAFTVPAMRMLAALEACLDHAPEVRVEGGRLYVKGGAFRAAMPLGAVETYPFVNDTSAQKKPLAAGLLTVLRTLRPFIGEDASRAWCASVLFDGKHATATNNVILARMPSPNGMPACAIPVAAIDEMLRLDEDPIAVGVSQTNVTFHYKDTTRVCTTLVIAPWPDVAAVLEPVHKGAKMREVTDSLESAVQRVARFAPDLKLPVVCLTDGRVETPAGELSAVVEGIDNIAPGTYHASPLLLVLEAATHADWSRFPRVPWSGSGKLVGVLMGVKP
jgi:DNA polymerase III sliding clamp (beta) subunit (PCNA family)